MSYGINNNTSSVYLIGTPNFSYKKVWSPLGMGVSKSLKTGLHVHLSVTNFLLT
jgi:hypothetical protein